MGVEAYNEEHLYHLAIPKVPSPLEIRYGHTLKGFVKTQPENGGGIAEVMVL